MTMVRRLARELRDTGTPLSGINDPTMPLYQSLAGYLDGLMGAPRLPNLPPVNYETAVRVTAVWRAVQIISGTIGTMPIRIVERTQSATKGAVSRPIDPKNPFYWLQDRPNPEVTSSVFWETSVGHCVLDGNAYWYVNRDGLGRPCELWPISPKRVMVGRDPDSRRKVYALDGDLDTPYVDFKGDDGGEIIHILGFTQDGMKGISPVRAMRLAMQLGLAAEEYGARTFSDGSVPGGIITTPANLDEDQAKRLKARWEQYHRGLPNAHRVAVLDNDAKWQPTSLNPDESQFLQTREFQVQEIARMFGVAPHLLADVSGSTSWGRGIEEQNRNTVTYTLGTYIARFQDAATQQLMIEEPTLYLRFDQTGLLRGDVFQRYRAYALGRQWGFLSTNDIRASEDLPPVEGGDEVMMPITYQNVAGQPGLDPDDLVEQLQLNAG